MAARVACDTRNRSGRQRALSVRRKMRHPDSFERNLKYELLHLSLPQRQKRLKPGTIPTLNLPTIKDASTSATSDRGVKRPEQFSDSQQEGTSTSATKKLKTDVTPQSSSHPSFIQEETHLLQAINQHLYFHLEPSTDGSQNLQWNLGY
ncbi:hypothetical protein Pmani_012820 [Petrolisthes manimaculis]|uniref:Uncharacterized protein n=1 Tax=Petrolisthes manimaculis TaxID=1843537 RepID=A0AAE1PW89_9EUCA|nr:hypothetical protein Pmani_012820 [Petrolisthes manimaculis]